jgi:hypothetical protein
MELLALMLRVPSNAQVQSQRHSADIGGTLSDITAFEPHAMFEGH